MPVPNVTEISRTKYDRKHIVPPPGAGFNRHLAAAMRTTDTYTVEIGPSEAEAMLAFNDRNRPVTAAKVALYAAEMTAGKWRYTRVPIIFSAERLIDGQHRLCGVIKSGATIKADVSFGAPDEAFAFIDVGKPRTAADIFSINGVPNAATMAAAMAFVIGYDDGTIGTATNGSNRPPAADLYASYCQHPDLQKSAFVNHAFAASRLAPPSMMCALHYICARKSRAAADEFFAKVADGVNVSRGDPALALRNVLIRNAADDRKLSRRAVAGLTITAWNHTRRGREITRLQYDVEKPFPRAQ